MRLSRTRLALFAFLIVPSLFALASCTGESTQQALDTATRAAEVRQDLVDNLEEKLVRFEAIALAVEEDRMDIEIALDSVTNVLPEQLREDFTNLRLQAENSYDLLLTVKQAADNALDDENAALQAELARIEELREKVQNEASFENFLTGATGVAGAVVGPTGIGAAILSILGMFRHKRAHEQTIEGVGNFMRGISKDAPSLEASLKNHLSMAQDKSTKKIVARKIEKLKL